MISINPKTLYVRDQKTGKFIPLLAIRGAQGPPGQIANIADYLTSETGDSVELAMSQKGVTLLFSGIETVLEDVETELTKAKADLTKVTNSLKFLYGNGTLGLEYILDSNGNYYSVAGIGTATDTEIFIPSNICGIPVEYILPEAFKNCTSITGMTIGKNIKSIDDFTFNGCSNLTGVTIPDSVTSIGEFAFAYCISLTSVTMGNGVTSIGKNAFYGCSHLTNITIPNSVTSIGVNAFFGCSNLNGTTYNNAIYLGNTKEPCLYLLKAVNKNITSATIHKTTKFIGENAFYDCSSLTSVTIPDSVTKIGYAAFSNCNSLTDIYYQGTEAEWENIEIASVGNECLDNVTIHFESSLS